MEKRPLNECDEQPVKKHHALSVAAAMCKRPVASMAAVASRLFLEQSVNITGTQSLYVAMQLYCGHCRHETNLQELPDGAAAVYSTNVTIPNQVSKAMLKLGSNATTLAHTLSEEEIRAFFKKKGITLDMPPPTGFLPDTIIFTADMAVMSWGSKFSRVSSSIQFEGETRVTNPDFIEKTDKLLHRSCTMGPPERLVRYDAFMIPTVSHLYGLVLFPRQPEDGDEDEDEEDDEDVEYERRADVKTYHAHEGNVRDVLAAVLVDATDTDNWRRITGMTKAGYSSVSLKMPPFKLESYSTPTPEQLGLPVSDEVVAVELDHAATIEWSATGCKAQAYSRFAMKGIGTPQHSVVCNRPFIAGVVDMSGGADMALRFCAFVTDVPDGDASP